MADRTERGRQAEALVASRLERQGFRIIGRNVRVGRLELDIIAQRRRLIVVCEVRSRAHDRVVSPAETIDRRKIARIRRATAQWLSEQAIGGAEVRFDAASVLFDGPEPRIDYYEHAF